jgi:hypothetical protein
MRALPRPLTPAGYQDTIVKVVMARSSAPDFHDLISLNRISVTISSELTSRL